MAAFAQFTLHLVYAISNQFSKVRAFVFIDSIDEVTRLFEGTEDIAQAVHRVNTEADVIWVDGHSDYGHAFEVFWQRYGKDVGPKTTLLLLGDARNNYHATQSWVVKEMQHRARHVYWLNPEPRATGTPATRSSASTPPTATACSSAATCASSSASSTISCRSAASDRVRNHSAGVSHGGGQRSVGRGARHVQAFCQRAERGWSHDQDGGHETRAAGPRGGSGTGNAPVRDHRAQRHRGVHRARGRRRPRLPRLLATPPRLIASAVRRFGGRFLSHAGDGTLAVFDEPVAALAASVEPSEALGDEPWPAGLARECGWASTPARSTTWPASRSACRCTRGPRIMAVAAAGQVGGVRRRGRGGGGRSRPAPGRRRVARRPGPAGPGAPPPSGGGRADGGGAPPGAPQQRGLTSAYAPGRGTHPIS